MSNIDSIHSLTAWQPPDGADLISGGILQPGSRMFIFGGPKCWKSMLALHTAFCLATGRNWFGFHTWPCVPYKFQVELPKATDRKRTLKYSDNLLAATGREDLAKPRNMFFRTDVYIKLDSGVGLKSLDQDLAQIAGEYPNETIVLILDPVYKLISGHIEDSYDVQKLLDNLDLMMNRYRMAIILLHHSRKSKVDAAGKIVDLGSEESTGSRYLANWCDTMIQARLMNPHAGKDKVQINFELTRNAEEPLPILEVKWDRSTLLPDLLSSYIPEEEEEEESVRKLLE